MSDFNDAVNMSSDELEKWLKGSKSKSAGRSKEDGSREAIGHESYAPLEVPNHRGRKTVHILKKTPKKDPSKYDETDLEHMRR
jgi:Protein of unknown function (DUF3140)